ncbi:14740_t:CDS:2 [Funneliformis mosseae]|uniref:14740_t:CDS:1 n=1 Tax=Funneliformis mosseae TaxID=27381 RepID=A0A9N9A2H4_FUNMO|nr:14740_t:CDS:2 [Funneliformis mosseae]
MKQLPENKFVSIIKDQSIIIIPEFKLHSGIVLHDVSVAYKTWGKLNQKKNNVMLICNVYTGSADFTEIWSPLMIGKGKAFDTTKFFVFCANVLGSAYGTSSSLTINPDTGKLYGPTFPLTTPRDDVRLQKLVLESLGVKQVAICIGGSLGGMQVLEWALVGKQKDGDEEFVKTIVPIATCAKLSAWAIAWNEVQRQTIYNDPLYCNGFYDPENPPSKGLFIARMNALITYRSRNAFELNFGRDVKEPDHYDVNEPPFYQVQSYLNYQSDKFIKRFDANCYISLTHKLDNHDISNGRGGDINNVLKSINQPALILGLKEDVLFPISEQYNLAENIPNSEIVILGIEDGHCAFLNENDTLNNLILGFIKKHLGEIFDASIESEFEE